VGYYRKYWPGWNRNMRELEDFLLDLKRCSSGNDEAIFGPLFQQFLGGGKIFLVNDLHR